MCIDHELELGEDCPSQKDGQAVAIEELLVLCFVKLNTEKDMTIFTHVQEKWQIF